MLKIADGGPSQEAIESNAHGLAAYAKIAQVHHFLASSCAPSFLMPVHMALFHLTETSLPGGARCSESDLACCFWLPLQAVSHMTVFIRRPVDLGCACLLGCSLVQFFCYFCLDMCTGPNLMIAGMLMSLCDNAHEH